MGLDVSHDCWSGSYSSFHRWRSAIAKAAGIPLELMEGFYEENLLHPTSPQVRAFLPIRWDNLKPDVLHVLLDHSDCEGIIEAKYCTDLASKLEALLPSLDDGESLGRIVEQTKRFIDGLKYAASAGEDVEFS